MNIKPCFLEKIENDNYWGSYQTTTRFNIPHFDNPFSCYYLPNNYLTNSSLLMLITLNSAFTYTL